LISVLVQLLYDKLYQLHVLTAGQLYYIRDRLYNLLHQEMCDKVCR
jgi:hypothetical protein